MKNALLLPLLLILLTFVSCVTNKTPPNLPKGLTITILSGSCRIHYQGEITVKQEYFNDSNKVTNDFTHSPNDSYGIIPRGTKTVDETITLSDGEIFHYTLQSGETLICTIRSLSEEAKIQTTTGSISKDYTILLSNRIGKMISFNN
jgi:hypothetical protein